MGMLRTQDLAIKLVPGVVIGGELRPPGHFAKAIHAPFALADDLDVCAQGRPLFLIAMVITAESVGKTPAPDKREGCHPCTAAPL